ncbi:unnamed protein product, partial [Mesorhabditis belari]|uniref:N(6)-L-threonylcarbamoyladenine synthase n=1 Tax=Mesorhabditis belari TaxID=2138241 RepID=A0AAF3EW93_9BILA
MFSISTRWNPTVAGIALRTYRTTVLGIEASCDDSAVALVNGDGEVLARRAYANREIQARLGGIVPSIAAEQHRNHLMPMIDECLRESGCQLQDLSGVAVSNRPGLVVALKAGVQVALNIARRARTNLIPIHHMRAHALSALLVNKEIRFPFIAVLLSGGHCLFTVCDSPDNFRLLGQSFSGSPGECLDKVGREIGVHTLPEYQHLHIGAAVERLAKIASSNGHFRYTVNGPSTSWAADTDFSSIKASFLMLISKEGSSICIEDFCASVQFSITRHIASRLHAALNFLRESGDLEKCQHVVIGGGVAANAYIAQALSKVVSHYGLRCFQIPKSLCTDNGEMIAWNGILSLNHRSSAVIPWDKIPDQLYCLSREDIGDDIRERVQKPKAKISAGSLHPNLPLRITKYS